MKSALIICPHQCFAHHPGLDKNPDLIILNEDPLFFGDAQYPCRFHKQKLILHRASMQAYYAQLEAAGHKVHYVAYSPKTNHGAAHLEKVFDIIADYETVQICTVADFVLEKRIAKAAAKYDLNIAWLPSPSWLNTAAQNKAYRAGKKRWFMADFYKTQRQNLGILMDGDEPVGGKWSFDEDNRKKVPKNRLGDIPELQFPPENKWVEEAKHYVQTHFPNNPGQLETFYYPVTHQEAEDWLKSFLEQRFTHFGPYEDAIVEGENWLWHSVLTPMLNTGLLTPKQVIDATLDYSTQNEIPLASLEGFIRQIIGWREFMRATYEDLGVTMRTTNHWQHKRPMPTCFYDASTGIDPIDDTIRRVLDTGYCHHIERLMVLGGFMFLCEIDPQHIYTWFMELFIDSYDWVMVPNVYAMSQNADGGLITTKPYFSGSNYIRKMSHHKPGEWSEIWDGLYWCWIINHADELRRNPRWAMMTRMADKMPPEKKQGHVRVAEAFLAAL